MKKTTTLLFFKLIVSLNFCFAQQAEANFLNSLQKNQTTFKTNYHKIISESVYPITIATPLSIVAYSAIKKDSIQFRKSAVIASSILLAGAFSTGLKFGIERPRPYVTFPNKVTQLIESGPHSFPSGHTTFAFSTATSLSLQYKKWYVAVPAFLWAGSVGYSRMYLGVHYPSDVAAGMLTGIGSALLTNYLNKKLFLR